MSLLDWIYPPKCISCRTIFTPVHNAPRKWICKNCRPLLIPAPEPIGRECLAAFVYDDLMRDMIHNMKFRSERRIAQGLGILFAEEAAGWGLKADVIVPVPLHPSKRRIRGFNQAEVLAKPVADALGIPIAPDMILRVKKTLPQSGLSVTAREENLMDAFTFNNKKHSAAGKRIILIDDIYTSGATMNACSEILMRSGADEIRLAALSMVIKDFSHDTNTTGDF